MLESVSLPTWSRSNQHVMRMETCRCGRSVFDNIEKNINSTLYAENALYEERTMHIQQRIRIFRANCCLKIHSVRFKLASSILGDVKVSWT